MLVTLIEGVPVKPVASPAIAPTNEAAVIVPLALILPEAVMLEEIGALRFMLVASILNNPLLSVTIAPKNPVPPFSNLNCVGPVAADFILTPVLPPDSTSNAYVGVVVPYQHYLKKKSTF